MMKKFSVNNKEDLGNPISSLGVDKNGKVNGNELTIYLRSEKHYPLSDVLVIFKPIKNMVLDFQFTADTQNKKIKITGNLKSAIKLLQYANVTNTDEISEKAFKEAIKFTESSYKTKNTVKLFAEKQNKAINPISKVKCFENEAIHTSNTLVKFGQFKNIKPTKTMDTFSLNYININFSKAE